MEDRIVLYATNTPHLWEGKWNVNLSFLITCFEKMRISSQI